MCCGDESLDELEVVAALGRRGEELRLQQPVEAEQRGIARELVLDERGGGVRALVLEHQREQRVEEIERRILRLVAAQHADALRRFAELAIGVREAVGRQRQERGILRLDLLPRRDRVRRSLPAAPRASPASSVRARAAAVGRERSVELGAPPSRSRP